MSEEDPKALIAQRKEDYGSVEVTAQRFVTMSSLLQDIEGNPSDTDIYCLTMIFAKLARLLNNPSHQDSLRDIQGYVELMLHGD